ncbi:cytidine and deoxycytidylate deaminase zinc-binding region domain-containing protein [Cardiosporidium cionae]|uniref:dCMP deaminase n=1 Tax=Cardiosporidium cionae TaxID=476202 RepID=A0ABQ7J808_9APIC|nr:cytidine and deoxycytidylate deaminase zinc-binding region domain-containing protein [Cardiosporidium cionae]|eukprot:KAF8820099.1 cytidine and deoxycytidylate deaminase zinc-binding region domain-containing protein [Cardiosporidium cionae]
MVLIAVTGPRYSGKKTVAALLAERSFKRLYFSDFFSACQKKNERTELNSLCSSFTKDLRYSLKDSSNYETAAENGQNVAYPDAQLENYELDAEVLDAIRALDRYVLSHWKERFVLTGVDHPVALCILKKRPSVIVFFINALFKIRLERFIKHVVPTNGEKGPAMHQFIQIDTEFSIMTDADFPHVHKSVRMSNIKMSNNGTLQQLEEQISNFNFLEPELFRPSWDFYFMKMAFLASWRSSCLKRRVGAVVVRDNRVVSTGYNGTPSTMQNCNDGGCIRCANSSVTEGQHLDTCVCIHAETNALLEAGRAGCYGSYLYVTCTPCLSCCKHIIQVGIKQVIYGTVYGEGFGAEAFLRSSRVTMRCLFENSADFPETMMNIFP